jgi:hypothetical protein
MEQVVEPTKAEPKPAANMAIVNACSMVDLSIGRWHATKHDKDRAKELADIHDIDPKRIRPTKTIMVSPELKLITTFEADARSEFRAMTLPWTDRGSRVAPNLLLMELTGRMQWHYDQYEKAVNSFMRTYDDAVEREKFLLKTVFKASDYPDSETVRGQFYFNVVVSPVATHNDFRLDAEDRFAGYIRDGYEKHLEKVQKTAVDTVWQRFIPLVKRVHENAVKSRCSKGMFVQLEKLCDVADALNFTGDVDLTAFIKKVKSDVISADPEVLKTDDAQRGAVAKTTASLEEQLRKKGFVV